jgi:hypothetical protein
MTFRQDITKIYNLLANVSLYCSLSVHNMFRALPRTQALWFVYIIKRTWDGEIDQINLRGPRKGRASHRTTHSAWVRGCSEHLDLFTSVYYIYIQIVSNGYNIQISE